MDRVSVIDLKEAKETVARELLLKSLHRGVLKRAFALRISSAVELASANLHAVGVGRKIVNGKVTKERCVRFYVVQKLPLRLLTERLPEKIDGLPTDVIESPPAFIWAKQKQLRRRKLEVKTVTCSDNRTKRVRPVIAGVSAAHESVTAGTISYFCRSTLSSEKNSRVFVLSNNHVFADVNNGQPGDRLLQPGPADQGTATDQIASLTRYVQIQLGGDTPNRVDAAIGEILPRVDYNPEVCTIGRINGIETASEDLAVRKHGRTTGYTEGTTTDISYDAVIGMDHANPDKTALFENQIRIEKTSPYDSIGRGGDSGSLIVAKAKLHAVGLYLVIAQQNGLKILDAEKIGFL